MAYKIKPNRVKVIGNYDDGFSMEIDGRPVDNVLDFHLRIPPGGFPEVTITIGVFGDLTVDAQAGRKLHLRHILLKSQSSPEDLL